MCADTPGLKGPLTLTWGTSRPHLGHITPAQACPTWGITPPPGAHHADQARPHLGHITAPHLGHITPLRGARGARLTHTKPGYVRQMGRGGGRDRCPTQESAGWLWGEFERARQALGRPGGRHKMAPTWGTSPLTWGRSRPHLGHITPAQACPTWGITAPPGAHHADQARPHLGHHRGSPRGAPGGGTLGLPSHSHQ